MVNAVGKPDFTRDLGGVRVGDDVWIGGYCVLKGGIRIGTGAVVAAGSVVVRDVDPYTIVGGVPAKPLRERSAAGVEGLARKEAVGSRGGKPAG